MMFAIVFMEEEKRLVVISVTMVMLIYEILGFEEVFPFFTHTSKADDGFYGKPLENVGDYIER